MPINTFFRRRISQPGRVQQIERTVLRGSTREIGAILTFHDLMIPKIKDTKKIRIGTITTGCTRISQY